jgi:hypothetical protein
LVKLPLKPLDQIRPNLASSSVRNKFFQKRILGCIQVQDVNLQHFLQIYKIVPQSKPVIKWHHYFANLHHFKGRNSGKVNLMMVKMEFDLHFVSSTNVASLRLKTEHNNWFGRNHFLVMPLFSSPDPKCHVRYCHHLASVRPLTFHILIWHSEHVCCLNLTSISYSFWNKGQKVLTFWKFDEKKGNNSKLGTQINFKITG